MSESTIWLLVVDEASAQIFASHNGSSRLLRSIPNEDNVFAIGADDAWRDRAGDFAYELMTILDEGADAGACEGIAIFATPAMMPALERFMPLSVYRKLIAKIIDVPGQRGAALNTALTAIADDAERNAPVQAPNTFLRAVGGRG